MDTPKELNPPFISIKGSYLESLKYILGIYINYISQLKTQLELSKKVYNSTKDISSQLIRSIEEYLIGNSGESYRIIQQLLRKNITTINFTSYSLTSCKPLIRLRESNDNLLNRKDLFHIPFKERQIVTKKRYSIEGLPCLYLSATSYTAWLELNRPIFNSLWASSFKVNSDLEILDLSFTLEEIINKYWKGCINKEELSYRLELIPIIISTSFRVKYHNVNFHEEYIVSGNILQWIISNTRFKGIRYLSTKLNSYNDLDNLWCASNFVIPPFNANIKENYNKFLAKRFYLTNPQNCATLIAYSNAGGVTCFEVESMGLTEIIDKVENDNKNIFSSIDRLIYNNYNNTSFYNIDAYIRNLFAYNQVDISSD